VSDLIAAYPLAVPAWFAENRKLLKALQRQHDTQDSDRKLVNKPGTYGRSHRNPQGYGYGVKCQVVLGCQAGKAVPHGDEHGGAVASSHLLGRHSLVRSSSGAVAGV